MATIKVIDQFGKAGESVKLEDSIFAIEPNMPVMHRTVKAQRAGWRQGTANVKGRSDVSGGGKKPWRQKGTGRARAGSNRSPVWVGGGVVFGPHTRSYDQKVNKKEIKLALKSALSAKLADKELIVVKNFDVDEGKPSTKLAIDALEGWGVYDAGAKRPERITLVIKNDDIDTFLSFRNLQFVDILPVNDINCYELLDNKKLVIQADCIKYIEEVLK